MTLFTDATALLLLFVYFCIYLGFTSWVAPSVVPVLHLLAITCISEQTLAGPLLKKLIDDEFPQQAATNNKNDLMGWFELVQATPYQLQTCREQSIIYKQVEMEKMVMGLLLGPPPAAHLLLNLNYSLQGERNPIESERMKNIICWDKLTFVYHFPVLTFGFWPNFFFFSIHFSPVPD